MYITSFLFLILGVIWLTWYISRTVGYISLVVCSAVFAIGYWHIAQKDFWFLHATLADLELSGIVFCISLILFFVGLFVPKNS